jgi:hypothetical protein
VGVLGVPGVLGLPGAGTAGTIPELMSSRRLGDCDPIPEMTFVVAPSRIAAATVAGVAPVLPESRSAAAPATCGAAMDVPDSERDPVVEVLEADTIAEPGANTSTHDPQFE